MSHDNDRTERPGAIGQFRESLRRDMGKLDSRQRRDLPAFCQLPACSSNARYGEVQVRRISVIGDGDDVIAFLNGPANIRTGRARRR